MRGNQEVTLEVRAAQVPDLNAEPTGTRLALPSAAVSAEPTRGER